MQHMCAKPCCSGVCFAVGVVSGVPLFSACEGCVVLCVCFGVLLCCLESAMVVGVSSLSGSLCEFKARGYEVLLPRFMSFVGLCACLCCCDAVVLCCCLCCLSGRLVSAFVDRVCMRGSPTPPACAVTVALLGLWSVQLGLCTVQSLVAVTRCSDADCAMILCTLAFQTRYCFLRIALKVVLCRPLWSLASLER